MQDTPANSPPLHSKGLSNSSDLLFRRRDPPISRISAHLGECYSLEVIQSSAVDQYMDDTEDIKACERMAA
jgi:hypothetical protein